MSSFYPVTQLSIFSHNFPFLGLSFLEILAGIFPRSTVNLKRKMGLEEISKVSLTSLPDQKRRFSSNLIPIQTEWGTVCQNAAGCGPELPPGNRSLKAFSMLQEKNNLMLQSKDVVLSVMLSEENTQSP